MTSASNSRRLLLRLKESSTPSKRRVMTERRPMEYQAKITNLLITTSIFLEISSLSWMDQPRTSINFILYLMILRKRPIQLLDNLRRAWTEYYQKESQAVSAETTIFSTNSSKPKLTEKSWSSVREPKECSTTGHWRKSRNLSRKDQLS